MPAPAAENVASRRRGLGRLGKPYLVAGALIAVLLTLMATGSTAGTLALWSDTSALPAVVVDAASIKAVSDVTASPAVTFSAGVTEKTGGLTVTNSGTIAATYRTVTTATGSAPLASGIRVTMWPSTSAAGCNTPVTPVTGTWASFPALTGTLNAGASQFYCITTALTTPVGLVSGTAVTATFATTLSSNNWTSAASSAVTQSFADAPPSAPTNLTFSGTTATSTTLNWTASTDDVAVTGYSVYRNGTLVGSTTGASSLIITGLTASTAYSYTVKAKDGAEQFSVSSPVGTVTTLAVGAPTGWFQIVNTKSKLCIDASGSGTTNFTPLQQRGCSNPAAANQQWSFQGPNADGYYTVVPRYTSAIVWDVESASNTNAARIILYGPNSGTNQQWSVIAVGAGKYQFVARNSGKCMSVVGGATTVGATYEQVTCNAADPAQTFSLTSVPAADTQAPNAPTNLAASTTTSTSVTLTWSASTDNVGVTGYVVYRDGVQIGETTSAVRTYSNTGLAPGTRYTFTVRAKDAAGNLSVSSNTATVTTLLGCAYSDPNSPGYWLNYSWTNNSKNDSSIEGYQLSINGVAVGERVNRWADAIGAGNEAHHKVARSGSTVPVVVKQILTNGQERVVATGSVRLTTDRWNNKLAFCA